MNSRQFERVYLGGRAYKSKWTSVPDLVVVLEAKQYDTRNQWRTSGSASYQEVHKHRQHLIHACTAHMLKAGDPFGTGYQIYVYEFNDNTAYVGLTCNPTRRHKNHQVKGPVSAKIKSGVVPELKVVKSGLKPAVASKTECETILQYQAAGWIVLNRRNGGSTGNVRSKYTYQKLLSLAQPFKTKNNSTPPMQELTSTPAITA